MPAGWSSSAPATSARRAASSRPRTTPGCSPSPPPTGGGVTAPIVTPPPVGGGLGHVVIPREPFMVDNAPVLTHHHAGLTIEGWSRAAVQSYWRVPELKVG